MYLIFPVGLSTQGKECMGCMFDLNFTKKN
jgi:hypothetical protein